MKATLMASAAVIALTLSAMSPAVAGSAPGGGISCVFEDNLGINTKGDAQNSV